MEPSYGDRMDVIVPGTWDKFHNGHKALLDYAREIADGVVYVCINTEKLSKQLGKDLINDDITRLKEIDKYCEEKQINMYPTFINKKGDTIKRALECSPCFWLTGTDWNLKKTSERNNVPVTFWEDNDIYLIYKDRVPNISSTKLRGQRCNQ